MIEHEVTTVLYQSFLAEFEGVDGISDDYNREKDQHVMSFVIENEGWFMEFREIDSAGTVAILNDQSM
jgi:hypothetical protein